MCRPTFGSQFGAKSIKKNDHPKTWNLMPKGFQKGTNNYAQTHQKSMPTQVSKKIMKIIKNHVSLEGKIIEFFSKNNGFEGLAGCARERKRYQNNIKSETKFQSQIDEKSIQSSCSKKGYPKHKTSSNK